MKRLNPQTGKPFRLGDPGEDGLFFIQYHTRGARDGFLREYWASAEQLEKVEAARQRRKERRTGRRVRPADDKRINRYTGQPFRRGDVREDGLIFHAYGAERRANGYLAESWLTREAFDRMTVRNRERCRAYKRRRSPPPG